MDEILSLPPHSVATLKTVEPKGGFPIAKLRQLTEQSEGATGAYSRCGAEPVDQSSYLRGSKTGPLSHHDFSTGSRQHSELLGL